MNLRGHNRPEDLLDPYPEIERLVLERRRQNRVMEQQGMNEGVHVPEGEAPNEHMGMDPVYLRRNGNGNGNGHGVGNGADGRQAPLPQRGIGNPPREVLRNYQRPVIGVSPSCIVLSPAARNYELKGVHFSMLPSFHGLASEDALSFFREFYTTIQTFPLHGLSEDDLRMRCFPYTLKDRAKSWLINLPEGSLRTCAEVYDKFMSKYYSPQKTIDLRNKICTFTQMDGEAFHEAWEKFKTLLTQCPHHQFPLALLTQFFYEGLTPTNQAFVDTASGGFVGDKTAEEAWDIYETVANNIQNKAVRSRRGTHVNEIAHHSPEVTSRLDELTRCVKSLMKEKVARVEIHCGHCGSSDHAAESCMYYSDVSYGGPNQEYHDEVNYMGEGFTKPNQHHDPYSNSYNPG